MLETGCGAHQGDAVMKRLLVLGGGTAGTMIVNKLRRGWMPASGR